MANKKIENSLDRLNNFITAKNSEIDKISLNEQKAEVIREIKIRETVYSKMVASNKMTLGEKTKKINTMSAVLRTLESVSRAQTV